MQFKPRQILLILQHLQENLGKKPEEEYMQNRKAVDFAELFRQGVKGIQ